MLGLDYSMARPDPAFIKAQGFDFVLRYLSYTPGKNISPQEAASLLAAGVSIGLVWETYAQRPLEGYAAGADDARQAAMQAKAVGQPDDRPIYFAVDWDASASEQPAIDDYLRGAASVIGFNRVGVYGGYHVVRRCHENGTAKWLWQTYAWSSGRVYEYNHLYQYSNGEWKGSVDFNEAKQKDFGQWPYSGKPKRRHEMFILALTPDGWVWGCDLAQGTRYHVPNETALATIQAFARSQYGLELKVYKIEPEYLEWMPIVKGPVGTPFDDTRQVTAGEIAEELSRRLAQ